MKTIVWVHGDSLSHQNAALQAAPGAPALFVWDEPLLRQWHISLKRVTFMYECLLEMPVTIRRGAVVGEIVAFAEEHGAERILTTASPSPRHRRICELLRQQLPDVSLEIVRETPLVTYEGKVDLKRFYRYWSVIRDQAIYPKKHR